MKISALDKDDLQIISSMLQDAVLRVSDIHFEPSEMRAFFVVNRFNWEKCNEDESNKEYCRSVCTLAVENVLSLQIQNIQQKHEDRYIEILMVDFIEESKPSGYIKIICADGIAIRCKVEYLDVKLLDLGKEWKTNHKPYHKVIEGE